MIELLNAHWTLSFIDKLTLSASSLSPDIRLIN